MSRHPAQPAKCPTGLPDKGPLRCKQRKEEASTQFFCLIFRIGDINSPPKQQFRCGCEDASMQAKAAITTNEGTVLQALGLVLLLVFVLLIERGGVPIG